jgi:hypothetical protein
MSEREPERVDIDDTAEREFEATLYGCLIIIGVPLLLGAVGCGCWLISGHLAGPISGWTLLAVLFVWHLATRKR